MMMEITKFVTHKLNNFNGREIEAILYSDVRMSVDGVEGGGSSDGNGIVLPTITSPTNCYWDIYGTTR